MRIHTSDKWIRIQEAQKHTDPTDPDPDSDSQHCFLLLLFSSFSCFLFPFFPCSTVSINVFSQIVFGFQWVCGYRSRLAKITHKIRKSEERMCWMIFSECLRLLLCRSVPWQSSFALVVQSRIVGRIEMFRD
jgi:hypothetical protein